MKFNSAEELPGHSLQCNFRTMNCTNEGCNARFCASHLVDHESICPFKILPCEQKCPDSIMRREMDKHCITVCPMKLVNCPFYPVGCQSTIPLATIEQHRLENLHAHVLYILQVIHKDAPWKNFKERVDQLKETILIEFDESPNKNEECTELVANDEESVDSSTREEHKESPNKTEDCTELVTNKEESVDSPTREERKESPNNEECEELVTNKDESIDSSAREEGSKESPKKKEECTESPSEEENYEEWPTKKEVRLPETISAWKDPSIKGEESSQSAIEEEECKISHKKWRSTESRP
ncbi:hypothetical protein Vadar_015767 [Vaccinium darrowii]|uniref:Uncharacterized protein n=1 Tax=Vaccinium darrowii TaxID=229202 RepID=A0ACB7Y6X8_9ERIC|nr:hypothetical protein Vadar_015767 [Vaccinium darrowii]